jgi:hypothetical protein
MGSCTTAFAVISKSNDAQVGGNGVLTLNMSVRNWLPTCSQCGHLQQAECTNCHTEEQLLTAEEPPVH